MKAHRTVVATVEGCGAGRSEEKQFIGNQWAATGPGDERPPCPIPVQRLRDRDIVDAYETSSLAHSIAGHGTDAFEQWNGPWQVPALVGQLRDWCWKSDESEVTTMQSGCRCYCVPSLGST
jgi:hypothetical protein